MKTSKRILAAVMVVLMVVTSAPLDGFTEIKLPKIAMPDFSGLFMTASAASEIDGLAYKEENGCITITGYSGSAASVVIPSVIEGKNVTKIGNSAFNNCKTLTSILIPDSVISIGARAFTGTSLAELKLPTNIEYIGSRFIAGTQIKSMTVPKTVKTMESNDGGYHGCFYDSNVETVVFEAGITKIPVKALHGAKKLTSVILPDTVTDICTNAFRECTSLKAITIPEGVKE